MLQIEQHHHQHHQHQQQFRQEYHGNGEGGPLPPPPNYYYLHGNSTGHYPDALATPSSNSLYSMHQQQQQQQQQQQPHHHHQHHHHSSMDHDHAPVALSASTHVPLTTNIYHDNNPRMDDSAAVGGGLAERDQFPSSEEFETIVQGYLDNLSSKKRDKALIDRHRYSLIIRVLKDPRNTAISTAQFRFWVKKMFQLVPLYSGIEVVCHDNKPVAMREEIYAILVRAHKEANHGGRDKTSALVRRRYSWIPKELIARFVRHCPFCISRRNGSSSPPIGLLPRTPPDYSTTAMSAAARGNSSCSTQPPPMTGLPYLPMELKSEYNEDDDLSTTNRSDHQVWPNNDRNQHHHHHHHQQPYFTSSPPPPAPVGAASPPSPASGPVSVVDFGGGGGGGVTPSSAAPPASSCSGMPPVSFEASNTLYHHSTLLSQCDITSLGYADVSTNEHVEHPPSYNTMCYTGTSESILPITTTTPPQQQQPQQPTAPRQHEQQQHSSNDPSSTMTAPVSTTTAATATGSYYYSTQPQQQNTMSYVTDSNSNENCRSSNTILRRPRANRDAVMLHHPLYSLSSPSPSTSFSSSSSASASSTSSPVSPTNSTAATPPFATTTTSSSTSTSFGYSQSMYVQHALPPSSNTTSTAPHDTVDFIGQSQRQF